MIWNRSMMNFYSIPTKKVKQNLVGGWTSRLNAGPQVIDAIFQKYERNHHPTP